MLRHEGGAVAPLFGMLVIPLLLVIGLAIDHSRALTLKARTFDALDAAALAAARAMQVSKLPDAEVIALANRFFNDRMAELGDTNLTVDPLLVRIDRTNDSVRLDAGGRINTYFGRLAGVDTLAVSATSAAVFGVKDIEVSLMLDVSGSMDDFGKIYDLKAAAREFFDILLPGTTDAPRARIGLAPYSTSVNAGAYARTAKGAAGGLGNTCVSERKGRNAFNDLDPATGGLFGAKASSCPTATLLALTDDKQRLIATINAYEPGGTTAGHLGIGWAWYLVSPSWTGVWPPESAPGAYDDKKVLKAVVLMTDGMFNKEYEAAANGTSAVQAAQLCQQIKGQNVLVFTVALQAPASVLPVLRGCASSPTYFFNVADGDGLASAYQLIARKLTELRLTQ